MESPQTSFNHVVAMPYPARGHINPMMNLCKLLVSNNNNIIITFVVTEEWLSFISSEPKPDNINFRSIPNFVPSELIRGRDHPAFLEAIMTKMEEPFKELLDLLDYPPSIIVYDTFLYWVVVVGNRRNIPVASFWTMSASIFTVFLHQHLLEQNGHCHVKFSGAFKESDPAKKACEEPSVNINEHQANLLWVLADEGLLPPLLLVCTWKEDVK